MVRGSRSVKKEILFLIPARLTRPYFSSLYCECENSIYTRFGDTFRCIWRCVRREKEEFDEHSVIEILRREMRQSDEVGLLVVAPTESEQLTAGVAKVAAERKTPVLALSLPFAAPHLFSTRSLPIPPALYCDSETGVRELALAALDELRKRRHWFDQLRVKLIPGRAKRTDSDLRLKSFREGLKANGVEPFVEMLPHCNWQRELARKEMKHAFMEASHPIDLIFAANDEMALGAWDAVRDAKAQGVDVHSHIYGFDAISEVRSLIADNNPHVKGTVEQDIPEMAELLADMVERVLVKGLPGSDLSTPTRCILPAPTHVPRLDEVAAEIPPLNSDPDEWVTAIEAARRDCVLPESLKRYRHRRAEKLDHEKIGRDRYRRIWRWDHRGRVFYWTRRLRNPNGVSLP